VSRDEDQIELDVPRSPTAGEKQAIMEARVKDLADEVNRERPEAAPSAGTAEEAPLELAELPKKPPVKPFVSPAERALFKKRVLSVVMVLFLGALGFGAWLFFSPEGKKQLPAPVRSSAEQLKNDVAERARDLSDPPLYTFTDDEGVPHIVDDLDKVPQRYRARALKKR
jgi:hypothetical protein